MIRILGTTLVALCCVLTGNLASKQLTNHVERLACALSFWRGVKNELSYTRSSPDLIFSALLSKHPESQSLLFLPATLARCQGGMPFPTAFQEGLEEGRHQWTKGEYRILQNAGALLGSSILEHQVEGLEFFCLELEEQLVQTKDYQKRHVGLYRSLGMTAGAAVLILLL